MNQTKERPILFSAPMVRAILNGTKTQTRRIVNGEALNWLDNSHFSHEFVSHSENYLCPHGNAGDRLWVREGFSVIAFVEPQEYLTEGDYDCDGAVCKIKYLADNKETNVVDLCFENQNGVNEEDQARRASTKKSVPSIHMPRWASRINLEIISVRLERLSELTEDDAEAEGIEGINQATGGDDYQDYWRDYGVTKKQADGWPWIEGKPVESFKTLWESINGPGSWDKNPWVWVVEFKKV